MSQSSVGEMAVSVCMGNAIEAGVGVGAGVGMFAAVVGSTITYTVIGAVLNSCL